MASQKLIAAVKALLDDIQSMRPRRGVDEENAHWFEGFPEFYVEKSDSPSDYGQEYVSVEWPNLSISAKAVEDALKEETPS